MYYVLKTEKGFAEACKDLEDEVGRQGFGILHIHDLGKTLREKGVDFKEECRIFEICNPQKASRVLAVDMRLNMALPCRVSVFTDKGATMMGLIKPAQMLSGLSDESELLDVAVEVEERIIKMINNAL